ncbi:MAG TPA: LysM peptidoglycan-binding domain-containing protein [Solirubrobacteraceae bacterium]|nr:LysM peptidoglycan-binding domain-containing protein [Solirubrobacteraceae bacterium]
MSDGNLVRYLAPAALVLAALAILITWQSSVESDAPSEPANQAQPAETAEDGGGEDGGDSGGKQDGGDSREQDGGDDSQAGRAPQAGDEVSAGEGKTYTVQAGDSLSTIAAETGVDVQTLLELNEGVNPQQLRAGDELQLGP